MAAKGRSLSILLAIVAIAVSSSAFASIPRPALLDPSSTIDRYEADAPEAADRQLLIIDRKTRRNFDRLSTIVFPSDPISHQLETRLNALTEAGDRRSLSVFAAKKKLASGPLLLRDENNVNEASELGRKVWWGEENHALPLREPATGLVYVRARWLDTSTGSFLTPDPMGYEDASNMYAYAGNDPINAADPSGELSAEDVAKGYWGYSKGFAKGAYGLFTGTIDAVIGVGKVAYYTTGAAMYNATGNEIYREQSETFHQAVDTVKMVVENPGVIKTAAGGAINNTKKTLMSGDAEAIGELVGRAGFELATTLVPALAASKMGRAGTVVRAMESADDIVDASRIIHRAEELDDLANLSAVERRASAAMKHGDEVVEAVRLGPCPTRLMPTCVAAGTLIAMPEDGAKPIEELRVGDRVATTNINPLLPDGSTTVDPINWHLLKLRMSGDAGDVYEIETLRPLEWIVAYEAFAGRTIEFETERSPIDEAYVVSVEKAPLIATGPGRVVLSTFTHRDQLLTIRFEDIDDSLETTPTHRLYSINRGEWVFASSLRVGDRVRASKGEVTVAAVEQRQISRVFDIEVEADHAYFATSADVMSHNCGSGIDLQAIEAGRLKEAELLSAEGLSKNTRVFRPGRRHIESPLFSNVVGEAKFTATGKARGTIFEAVGDSFYVEIKSGKSELKLTYQLRLQTYYALKRGKTLRIRTSRPLSPHAAEFFERYRVSVEGFK